MANKKKKKTHRRTTYRRRVSGIKDVDFTVVALTIGGAVLGRVLSNKLAASTNTTLVKLAPYSAVALGIILPMVTKAPMLKALSMGLVAGGGVTMLGQTGLKVISGMESTVNGAMGYPYNAIPPYKKVAGIYNQEGKFVNKANFSGSGLPQTNVISGVHTNAMGCGDCSPMN